MSPGTRPPLMGAAIAEAKELAGEGCGEDEAETLRLVAEALTLSGHCAAGPWGKSAGVGDAVAVRAPDGLYEEWHVVAFTTGCWTLNPYKNAWPHKGEPGPAPAECGEPIPPELSHFRGPSEKGCSPWCDATPYVCDQAYCRDIGFTDGRRCCAVRVEGTSDRQACERYVLGGEALWRSDGQVKVKSGNHLAAKCSSCTWLEACSAAGTKCNRKVF